MSLYDFYLKNSQVPKRYYDDIILRPSNADRQVFVELNEIRDNISQFVKDGNNLLICSNNVGNGKTTIATKLLKSYLISIGDVMSCEGTPALFVNVSNLLNEKKLAINDREVQLRINDLEKKILKANLVVFDDLGVKDVSQYDMGNLYYWIDYRTGSMKSSIYTSNLLPNQLSNLLDSRLYSRIVNYSQVKKITDGDHRGMK